MDLFDFSNMENEEKIDLDIKELDSKDIAIIGISGRFSMADNVDEYWDNILNKMECVREFPDTRREYTDKYQMFKGTPKEKLKYYNAAFLDKIDEFDPKEFKLSPKEGRLMDPRQKMFLEETWKAIEDAGYKIDELRGKRIGVYSGISDFGGVTYLDMLSELESESIELGVSGNFQAIIPSRVSYILDLKGPSMVVDTACSSSLVAIYLACQSLRNKECDAAIVGSVRVHLLPSEDNFRVGFESKDGKTKAFDDTATGTGVGEGAISVILKPFQKAKIDGDHIYAIIKGAAINQDGNSIGITAPNVDAQADVIEKACEDAGIHAEDISYIETHGTGTKLGDPIEVEGIKKAFSKYTSKKQFCAIGSVKSNIGHLYDASGLASVIKCVCALNDKILPPSINYTIPNKSIDFQDSPVYVNIRAREWDSNGKKRMCGISSFGLSGTNCHIILEEPDSSDNSSISELNENKNLLVLSGKNDDILKELINKYLEKFNSIKNNDPKDVCYTAAIGRNHYNHRLAIIFSDYDELKKVLTKLSIEPFENINNENVFFGILDEADKKELDYDLTSFDLNSELSLDELRKIASIYICSRKLQLNDIYTSSNRKRVSLPSCMFENEKCWLNIPEFKYGNIDIVQKSIAVDIDLKETILQGRGSGIYTDTERKIGAIMNSVMEYKSINVSANFYELGGDSIMAMKIYKKINDYFKCNITVSDIFSYPNVELLAKHIDSILNNKKEDALIKENDKSQYLKKDDDIAIIGMAGKFASANNIKEYWNAICNRENCVRNIPENRKVDLKNYFKQLGINEESVEFMKSGYLNEIDKFDYEYFGYSLKEATLMDPAQRLFLEVVYELLENAGYGGKRLIGSNTGVFIGYSDDYLYNYRRFIYDSDHSLTKDALSGNLNSIIPGRISYALDLKGPSIVLDTACSSSLVAINTAIESLRSGECEAAIVGGAKIKLIPICDREGEVGVESADFKIKAFDDSADGLAEGESVNALLLKPLKQAIKDKDKIRAVIKGAAVNQDGTGMGITAPRAETQTKVIIDAWNKSKIDPSTIKYIETHGTGTKLGDLVEYEALKNAFNKYTDKKEFCAISSVKTNIGHTYQASGTASLIKAVLSLENKKILPSINFNRPNRLIDFEDSPFYLNDMVRDWETGALPRRCGISSFGLSGTNCHVVLEEYRNNKRADNSNNFEIITLSAKNREALENIIKNYSKFIDNNEEVNLSDMGYTANIGRSHYNERLAFIIKDYEDFKNKIKNFKFEDLDEDIFYGKVDEKITYPKNIGDLLGDNLVSHLGEIYGFKIKDNLNKSILSKICQLYVCGVNIDWQKLYEGSYAETIELPTYPFIDKRCWFQPKPLKTQNVEYDGSSIIKNDYEILEEKELKDRKDTKLVQKIPNSDFSENDTSSLVLRAFEEVLAVNTVTREDNFFELGGNSLKATMLASKMYELVEVLISLSDILSYPNIGDLADYIETLVKSNPSDNENYIPKLSNVNSYELSLKQMELWLSTQAYGDSSAMNITWTCILENFDIDALYKALEKVVDRHTVMKSKIVVENEMPKVIINNEYIVKEAYHYIDDSQENYSEEQLMNIIESETGKQFDLENDPLIRVTLVKISESKYLFIFVISHMIADWWSMGVIINDLKKYYKELVLDIPITLKPLDINYFDFAAWHRQRVTRLNDKLKKYWDKVLQGPLPIVNLRTDFERPKIKGQVGRKFCDSLNNSVLDELKNIADINQGTMFMTLLTNVYILLYMYTGQTDIIVGTNTSGREHPQLEDQVGYYINVLPLRINLNEADNYAEVFDKVKDVTLGAFNNQDYPFISMLENESIVHDSSRSPIFDVVVQFLSDEDRDDIEVNDEKIVEFEYDSLESKYDLVFNFIQKTDEITLELEYSDALFNEDTIKRMVKRLNDILEMFSKDQNTAISKIDIQKKSNKDIKLIKRRRR